MIDPKIAADKIASLEAEIARLNTKAEERDALYHHCKALVEFIAHSRTAPPVTYAAAYLTQIVPPEEGK